MTRGQYKISKRALSDLEEIWHYTFRNWSLTQADRYYNLIINEIEHLSLNPQYGKPIYHIKKGYRVSKVKSHLIFYRDTNNETIEVIRILHERMDVESRL